jgi:hypothetical protein
MNPLISIPRDALADLLRASGSPLTPEQYLASLPESGIYRKYKSRALAAAINKYCLLVVAVFGVVTLPFLGFSVENVIIVIGLITVTCFEYRVHRYFLERNPAAPGLGFRNQSLFAAAILLYCIYSGFSASHLFAETPGLVEENNVIDPEMFKTVAKLFYAIVAIVAGGSQFGLACYYRSAEVKPQI